MSERPRDLTWDALTEGFGEPRTSQERARRNRAVKELKDAQATPEEIAVAIAFCEKNFTSFSEMAVCNWLSRALHAQTEEGASRDSFLRLVKGGSDDRDTGTGDR